MPIYQHKCSEHGVFEDFRPMARFAERAKCPVCGTECVKIVSVPHVEIWDADKEFENFGDEPMKFKSKREMSRYCNENGLQSGALL